MKTNILAIAAVTTVSLGSLVSSASAGDRFGIQLQFGNRQVQFGNRQVQFANPQSQFGARSHVDDLAFELQEDATAVLWEMYNNYPHNFEFRETYGEMYKLMLDARHIHELVHDNYHGSVHTDDHIARDLHEIDALFHHIEEDIVNWTPSYRGHSRHYRGHFNDMHGHIVHGPQFRDQLQLKMARLEATLHHLMSDYGVTSQLPVGDEAAPLPPNLGVQQVPQIPQTP